MNPTRRGLLSLLALTPAAGMARTIDGDAVVDHVGSRMIVLVRHAEKADDDPRDPSLSAIGLTRVAALTEMLAPLPLSQVLVTALRRTRLTAEPAARARKLSPTVVPFGNNVAEHAQAVAQQLLQAAAGTVSLVVGHSNTLPLVISELGGPLIEISEDRYVDLFLLLPQANGQPPWFLRASYGCASA